MEWFHHTRQRSTNYLSTWQLRKIGAVTAEDQKTLSITGRVRFKCKWGGWRPFICNVNYSGPNSFSNSKNPKHTSWTEKEWSLVIFLSNYRLQLLMGAIALVWKYLAKKYWCVVLHRFHNTTGCTITEKAPTRAFSWLKAATTTTTTTFTFKTLC